MAENPLRVRFYGDTGLAQLHLGHATKLLGMVRQQMSYNNLQQLSRRLVLPNGVMLQATSVFGQDEVRVFAPGAAAAAGRVLPQEAPGMLSIAGWYNDNPNSDSHTRSFLCNDAASALDLGIFEAGGYTFSVAYGVSGTEAVVGSTADAEGNDIAYLWSAANGMSSLGTTGDLRQMTAAGISVDGSVVCGVEYIVSVGGDIGPVHWRWTPPDGQGGGMVRIGLAADTGILPAIAPSGAYIVGTVGDWPYAGTLWSGAQAEFATGFDGVPFGVSDSAIVVGAHGHYHDTANQRAFRRDVLNETETDLGPGVATAISADSAVVVGYSHGDTVNQAWHWTEQGGRISLGDGQPWAVAATDGGYVAVGSITRNITVFGPIPSLSDFPPSQRPFVIVPGVPPGGPNDKLGGIVPIVYYPVTVPPILWDAPYRVPEGSAFAALVVALSGVEFALYPTSSGYKVIGYVPAVTVSWTEAVAVFALYMPAQSVTIRQRQVPVMWELTADGGSMTPLTMPGGMLYGEARAVAFARVSPDVALDIKRR